MALVQLQGVAKSFDHTVALDSVDLEIRDGELLVLLGPSGSGKTTLMRLCAGLETPTSGRILIDGVDVTDLPPRKRKIAMVFQTYALYPHKSVFKNIAFPLQVEGLPRREIKEKVEWAAGLFGITHLLQRMPSQLSGGERQRVAISRALVRRPQVFLMDEPLSNLDAKVRDFARAELKRFQHEIGVTTIFVTHDQIEAMGLGHRIGVLHEGRLRQIGTPEEIYDDPADTFVAGFIGTPPMNLVEAEDSIIGFRPEAFVPKETVGDQPRRDFRFGIEMVEELGSYSVIYGAIGGDHVRSRLAGRPHFEEGETYEFSVCASDLYAFDKASGARIAP
jgi:multiple sugar transport system ATP-binding protein